MGQCGCGDYNPLARFPAPGGHAYVLQLYGGCEYCETPAGVIIEHVRTAEIKQRGWEGLPVIDFLKHHELALPIVDPEELVKAMSEELGEDEVRCISHSRILRAAAGATITKFVADFNKPKKRRRR